MGSVVSILTFLLTAIVGIIGVRTRRLSQEAKEKRELREMNLAAMNYIYHLEMAAQELANRTGVKINVEKPKILMTSYLEVIAGAKDNSALSEMAEVMSQLEKDGKNILSGRTDE